MSLYNHNLAKMVHQSEVFIWTIHLKWSNFQFNLQLGDNFVESAFVLNAIFFIIQILDWVLN